jgi:sulfite exporter TauE/SafE
MDSSLALTAWLMGLAGGPHCLAMCGAACSAMGRRLPQAAPAGAGAGRVIAITAVRPEPLAKVGVRSAPWLFQLGRMLSYAALGAVAAASMQTVGLLSVHAAALRPLWSLMHVAAALLGLVLLWQARQPAWLEEGGLKLWRGLQSGLEKRLTRSNGPVGAGGFVGLARAAPGLLGLVWGLMPCGLLYSALLVAALSPGLWQGAAVMVLFALGSSVSLLAGPWLWRWLGTAGLQSGAWAVRLAGAALFAMSVWALWMGLLHNAAPWCVAPAAALY